MVFKPGQKRQNFDIKLEISDCAIERVRDIIFFMLTPILLYLDWKHFSFADSSLINIIHFLLLFVRWVNKKVEREEYKNQCVGRESNAVNCLEGSYAHHYTTNACVAWLAV